MQETFRIWQNCRFYAFSKQKENASITDVSLRRLRLLLNPDLDVALSRDGSVQGAVANGLGSAIIEIFVGSVR